MLQPLDEESASKLAIRKSINRAYHETSSRGKYYNLVKDDSMKEIMEYLDSIDFSKEIPTKMRKPKVKEINKEFFTKYAPLQNILYDFGEYADYINPLEIEPNYSLEYEDANVNVLLGKYQDLVIENINLSKKTNINSVGIYAHELTHTQLELTPNCSYHNYFLREALSIFIEKVITYELTSQNMRSIELMRLRFLKENLKSYNKYIWESETLEVDDKTRTYIVSTLEANHLFYIYANSTQRQKDNILKVVTNIFKKEDSVDRLFSSRKVNYTNSKTLKYIK